MKYLGNFSFFLRTEHWILIAAFLITEYWTLNTVLAKDIGTHGVIYPIVEEDPIALIQKKLKGMEERGELEQHNRQIQKKTKESVERPEPVEGITKAIESRVFTYDPTYTVKEDIKDHLGRVIYLKGNKINPLDTVRLSQELLFIDGDDLKQKAWAFCRVQTPEGSDQNGKKVKLILVKGAPLALSEELDIPVYFDQGGLLTKKLGIKHVPALVSQKESSITQSEKPLVLHIEEVCIDEDLEAHKGGENDPL